MMSIELQKQLKFLVEKLPESLDHYLVSTPRSLLAWIQMVGRRYDFKFFFSFMFLPDDIFCYRSSNVGTNCNYIE